MLVTSASYFLFLTLALALATLAKRVLGPGAQKIILILLSYYFYASFGIPFVIMLIAVTLVAFWGGRLAGRTSSPLWKQRILTVSALLCLSGILGFKYVPVALQEIAHVSGLIGYPFDPWLRRILIPVGISFYTFQAIAYLVDIHRNKITPTNSLRDFTLYMAFFPQLLLGPIVRPNYFLPQLTATSYEERALHVGLPGPEMQARYSSAFALILIGLIKKICIADVLALQWVNPVYADPGGYSSFILVLTTFAYSFQIYMDIAGYTDIVRGSARLFGFELPKNFDRPYLARTVSNYWQRWHITMSSFFRDYLYFILGGSKYGNVYFNLLMTFLAIGLWHGAGASFLLYGLLHGSIVAFERFRRKRREASGRPAPAPSHGQIALQIAFVFTFASLTRILFRSDSLNAAFTYVSEIARSPLSGSWALSPLALLAFLAAAALHVSPRSWRDGILQHAWRMPAPVAAGAVVSIVYLLIVFGADGAPFIYQQF